MDSNRSRSGMLIGLAATAFGAAAMMSAATAPTARADIYDDTINAIQFNFTVSERAFDLASADFAAGDVTAGLTSLLDGVDDDLLDAPSNAYNGIVDALTSEPFSGLNSYFVLRQPPDLTDAVIIAQNALTNGEASLADVLSAAAAGDYGTAAFDGTFGANEAFVVPLEELLLGVVASL